METYAVPDVPDTVPAEWVTPKPTWNHYLCYIEGLRRNQGKPGETLCGLVRTGPHRPVRPDQPYCQVCVELRYKHRFECVECQQHLGFNL